MNKILVIIPFYNTGDFLQEAIESILQQEYKNIHLVLVNDGSTDNSVKIAKYYENLPNVTLIENLENRGAYYSVNHALKVCKNIDWDYFHFHGSDDVSDLRRFSIINDAILKDALEGIKSTYVRVYADSKEIRYENGLPNISTSEGISFFSRKIFTHLGYYDNSRFSADTDYWWRAEALSKHKPELNIKLGAHLEPLYIAYLRKDKSNLTSQIPVSTRGEYFRKSQTEIQQMIQTGNFYRDIFE